MIVNSRISVLSWPAMGFRPVHIRYVLILLIALLVGEARSFSDLPRGYTENPRRLSLLRFGETLALADFDGDNRVDQAVLGGAGRYKSIEVHLSRTHARTLFQFATSTNDQGSLFSSDVDSDGDSDLIWTDLLHPEDVIVWLADGAGHFERSCSHQYAEEFVFGGLPAIGDIESSNQDLAIGPQRHQFPTPRPNRGFDYQLTATLLYSETRQVQISNCATLSPVDRGPPSLNS